MSGLCASLRRRCVADLLHRHRIHYGLLTLTALLAAAAFLTIEVRGHSPGPRTGQVITVLSWLPETVVWRPGVTTVLKGLFFAGAGLWLAQWLLPWSSWLAAAAFTSLVALHQERATFVDHVFHVPNMVLLLYATWSHVYAARIRAARRAGRFWSARLYPRWVHKVSLAYVAWFYTLAGVSKLWDGGLDWPNGVSMQIWAALWGRSVTPVAWILDSRELAVLLQWATLILETGAFLSLFWLPARIAFGLGLLGFHLGQHVVFGWAFYGNLVIIGLTFLPVFERMTGVLGVAAPPPLLSGNRRNKAPLSD
jgi:hypothetical protein